MTDHVLADLSAPMREELQTANLADILQQLPAVVYPPRAQIFAAFRGFTSLADVCVTIIGEDPYPNENADGLAFSRSLQSADAVPQSLRTIVDAAVIQAVSDTTVYNLENWRDNGVLLLNTYLTAEASRVKHTFWHAYTADIVRKLTHSVFMLWGRHAQQFKPIILGMNAHALIYEMAHPSPLAQNRLEHGSKFADLVQFRQVAQHLNRPDMWQLTKAAKQPDEIPAETVPAPMAEILADSGGINTVVADYVVEPGAINTVVAESAVEPVVVEPVVVDSVVESSVVDSVVVDSVVVDSANDAEDLLAITNPPADLPLDISKYSIGKKQYAGRLMVYIPKFDPSARQLNVVYRFRTETAEFVVRNTIDYEFTDIVQIREKICSNITGKLTQYADMQSADILSLMQSAEIIGNFPHAVADTAFSIRIYTRIMSVGILLPYPYKYGNWADDRMVLKHKYMF
jgi:uracil-DNA glycosylase